MSDTLTIVRPGPAAMESHIDAYEAACADGWPVDLGRFLPPPGHPDRAATLCELVRIDLENGWARGTPRPLARYRAEFPELFDRPDLAAAVEFEEARLRDQSAHADLGRTVPSAPAAGRPAAAPAAPLDVRLLEDLLDAVHAAPEGATATAVVSRIAGLAARTRTAAPGVGAALDRAGTLPQAGDDFLGFRLAEEIGAGTFGRVFLAHQAALSDRPVALKVTARPNREAQCLARLQHANIVPVLSVHRAGDLQAVCMPYYGRTTLAQVLGTLRRQKSLPASGLGLVSTLHAGVAETVPEQTAAPAAAPTPGDGPAPAVPEPSSPLRAMLGKLKYVDAVVWIAARLADGLAHAHDRGVLHRDLKPDNVLLADDGQPMLLDFNLADETGAGAAAAAVGGTVQYMAPEHLDVFTGDRRRPVDARSDLYALGLVLYELLTGRHPYPIPKVTTGLLAALRAARQLPAAAARTLNPAVPAAVDAALLKLLDPDPARRYQSARQLAEDLDAHLADRPLTYAAESRRARAGKWLRRHPRTLPAAGLAAALLLAAGFGGLAARDGLAQTRTQAAAGQEKFHDEAQAAAVLLARGPGDPSVKGVAAGRLRALLDGYGAADADDWEGRLLVRRLRPEARDVLRADVGQALFLLARAKAADPAEALQLNRRAEAAFGDAPPPALWRQRADLADRAGDQAAAADARAKASGAAPQSARDFYLDGTERAAAGDWAAAVIPLEEACRLDPRHVAAAFALAYGHAQLGRDAEALEGYRACVALQPAFPYPYVNRALVYMARKDDARARRDLDEAVRLDPDSPDARLTRGILHRDAGRNDLALADFDAAEALGSRRARLPLLRATVREKLNDAAGAARDRAAGLALPPTDEFDHAARGYALIAAKGPAEALAEFDAALALNPRSLPGLQNKAYVLTGPLNRPAEAVPLLDKLVGLYPAHTAARAGRAVLLAQLGRRAEAHRDAAECLRRDPSPFTLYQLAGVYALTSRGDAPAAAADRRESLRLLAAALTAGFRDFRTIDTDSDLDAVRTRTEFVSLVNEFRGRAASRP